MLMNLETPREVFIEEFDENPLHDLRAELEQEFDDILVDISEEELEGLTVEAAPESVSVEEPTVEATPAESAEERAYREMQETFLAIMQQILKPVTRYLKSIESGVECREIFEIVNFSVSPLIEKVEKVELYGHTSKLLDFKSTLTKILATHFGTLSEELRDELLAVYGDLRRVFDLELRGNVRAVANVLSFYRVMTFDQEVSIHDIRRFFAVGIPSITWIRRTSAAEISSLSGISFAKALRLKKLAEEYREAVRDKTDPDLSVSL